MIAGIEKMYTENHEKEDYYNMEISNDQYIERKSNEHKMLHGMKYSEYSTQFGPFICRFLKDVFLGIPVS